MFISKSLLCFVIVFSLFVYTTASDTAINMEVGHNKCQVLKEHTLQEGTILTFNIHSQYNFFMKVRYPNFTEIRINDLPDTRLSITYHEKKNDPNGTLDYNLSSKINVTKNITGNWTFRFNLQLPKPNESIRLLHKSGYLCPELNNIARYYPQVTCTITIKTVNTSPHTQIAEELPEKPGDFNVLYYILPPIGILCAIQTGIIITLCIKTRNDGGNNITKRPLPSIPSEESKLPKSPGPRKRLSTPCSNSLEEEISVAKNNRNKIKTPHSPQAHYTSPIHSPVTAQKTPVPRPIPQVAQCTRRTIFPKQFLPKPQGTPILQKMETNGSRDSDIDWNYEQLKPTAFYLNRT